MKKLFLLAAGYIAGSVVKSLYGDKKPEDIKKALKKSKKDPNVSEFDVLLNDFIDTHKNLFEDLKSEALSDKNKKLFNKKKKELLKLVDSYKDEAKNIVSDLKGKGKDFVLEQAKVLEDMYEEKKEEIKGLKDVAPEKIEDLKDKLLASFEDLKKKLKK